MTKLSVNINKLATLRNSRGGNIPDIIKSTLDIQNFGAEGITIHPRPDQRHITRKDAYDLKNIIKVEYNIEGNPTKEFMDMVLDIKPTQVTMVPDDIKSITSDNGWDTIKYQNFLSDIVKTLKKEGIRTSIFLNAEEKFLEPAKNTGTDRIEFYTGPYANDYLKNKNESIDNYKKCAEIAESINLGINAGHDLSLDNIEFFKKNIPNLLEVSIGHALICESLYLGLENVINMYLRKLR